MQQEPFDPIELERLADSVPWAARVVTHQRLGSTNDEAARLAAEGAPAGTVVVADEQEAGRGRLGRTWVAPPGTSLLASWIARPPGGADRGMVALAAGTATAAAVEPLAEIGIVLKWPNDLLAEHCGRKLGGILCEAQPDGAIVVGLGLNVRQDELPEEIAETATSLLLERSRPVARVRLLGAILNAFAPYADAPAACLDEYRRRCATIGKVVRVEQPGGVVEGTAVGVADDGALLVDAGGEQVSVRAGDVIHVR